jgi:hypothetical protein
MVFRQGDCCIALAAGAVPIQLQPIVVRGLGDVHMYYVLNPAVVAEVQAPRAGAPQAAEHAPLGDRPAPAAAVARQAGQLAAPGRHARPLLTPPPPLMRLQGAEAGPVRGLAAGHVTGMGCVLHWLLNAYCCGLKVNPVHCTCHNIGHTSNTGASTYACSQTTCQEGCSRGADRCGT